MGDLKYQPFPKAPLYAAGALIAFTLIVVATVRLTGTGPSSAQDMGPPLASRDLRFEDRADGAIAIFDATSGQPVDTIAPGSNGFLRVAMRSLARARKTHKVGPEPFFRLTRFEGGNLSLEDPSTGKRVNLRAFGRENAQSFAHLLPAQDGAR